MNSSKSIESVCFKRVAENEAQDLTCKMTQD